MRIKTNWDCDNLERKIGRINMKGERKGRLERKIEREREGG